MSLWPDPVGRGVGEFVRVGWWWDGKRETLNLGRCAVGMEGMLVVRGGRCHGDARLLNFAGAG